MDRTQFNFKKVKFDGKSVTVIYNAAGNAEEITSVKKTLPHPDLKASLQALRPLLTEVYAMHEENEAKFDVRGITLSENKGEQVLITAMFETDSGMKCCMNTPNIRMDGDIYENEATLGELVDKIVDETHEYLFKGKQAQEEFPFPDQSELGDEAIGEQTESEQESIGGMSNGEE
jgi:hypothetical protein